MFDIRSGHPLISTLLFCFSLLIICTFLISFVGSISSVLFLVWVSIVSHIYLPSTDSAISVLQGILKFTFGLLARGTAVLQAASFPVFVLTTSLRLSGDGFLVQLFLSFGSRVCFSICWL